MPDPSDYDIDRVLTAATSGPAPSTHPKHSEPTSLESLSVSLASTMPPGLSPSQGRDVASFAASSLIERYRLEKLLGRGGFGEVWKAYDSQAQRFVAIKGPRTDRQVTPQLVQLFLSEAEKAQQLAKVNIVPVLDVVQTPAQRDGEFLCFIVMQMMEGGSLADKFRRGERPTPRIAAAWIADLADTLAQIHAKGYIHRDIKPDNILFDAAGRPYFSDFGLAASALEQLAESRSVLGTVYYMAPEQARQQRVDRLADIYSLGVVLYQLLALPYVSQTRLALPYLANNSHEYLDALADPNHQPRALPEGVPSALAGIVEQRCLRDDKSQRYRSAADLSRDLRSWLRGNQWTRRGLLIAGGSLAVSAAAYGAYQGLSGEARPDVALAPAAATQPPSQPSPDLNQAIQLVSLLEQSAPNPASWSVNESLTALRIDDQDRTLIAFGRAEDEPLDFEITVQQPQWPGEIGVFFGHGPRQSQQGHQYQLIHIMRLRDGKYTLRGSVVEYHQAAPHGNHTSHIFGDWPLNAFQHHGNVIRFRLDHGQPIGIWVNGQDFGPDYLSKWQRNLRPDESIGRGHFGTYSARGPSVFTNPALHGKIVLLRQ